MSEVVGPAPPSLTATPATPGATEVPTPPDVAPSAPADGDRPPSPPRHRRRVHVATVVVLAIILAISLTLTMLVISAINDGDNRVLNSQLRQVTSALDAAIPAIQQPLVAADSIAADAGPKAFRSFVASDVGRQGTQAPFRSISLWRRTSGAPRLVEVVGQRPALLDVPGGVTRVLGAMHASARLSVTGLFSSPDTGLGFAEALPGVRPGLIVYAESDLPKPTAQFRGLAFALYLGHSISPSHLMESSVALPRSGRRASAVVPFGTADVTIVTALVGRPSGVLPSELPWGIALVGVVLAALAAVTTERLVRRRELAESVATDRVAQYDAQRGIAETLQRSLLPEEDPTFPGVSIATQYVAGVEHLDVGGDWHDAIRVDDDRLFVTVGDVAGRGLKAATVMASLRHAIRAYAVQGDDPSSVLRKLDGLVDVERDECFATVVCAMVEVPQRRVTIASAGHLPPLLIDDGGARFVAIPVNPPVGVASTGPPASVTLSVTPQTTIVFYTDGLVERRDRTLDDGLEALRRAVPVSGTPVARVLDEILESLLPEGSEDDVALLALAWPATTPATDLPTTNAEWRALGGRAAACTRRFPPEPLSVRGARAFVDGSLPDLERGVREVVALLVSELATNAVRHAKTDFEVTVVTSPDPRRVRVGVTDQSGGGPSVLRNRRVAPDGRGLQLVASLSEQWGVAWSRDRRSKTVWFEPSFRSERAADRDADGGVS